MQRKFTEVFHLCYNQGEVTSWKEGYHEFRTVRAEITPRNQSIRQGSQGNFFLEDLVMFSGPGSLVAVGYMDPGNWITSVVGGAHYRYLLLSVVLLSSLIAMQLQQMAGKLGIVHRKDLAQTTATHLPKWLRYILWIVIELALMATDLAEVIGSGIALHLLFGWPLLFSILVTIGCLPPPRTYALRFS